MVLYGGDPRDKYGPLWGGSEGGMVKDHTFPLFFGMLPFKGSIQYNTIYTIYTIRIQYMLMYTGPFSDNIILL